ncbi:MAG: VOC family protein [Alphaproteobacteria bacterium]
MKIQSLGHVVLKVSNMTRAQAFYENVLGLRVASRDEAFPMTFYTLGDHHDLAIMALGDNAGSPGDGDVGLAHVAFKIGDDVDTLRAARDHLEAAGVAVAPVDHGVTKSLYFDDPDGNQFEVYVDVSDDWKRDPDLVAQARPLEL